MQGNIVIAITSTLAHSDHRHLFGSACSRVWRTAVVLCGVLRASVRCASAQQPALHPLYEKTLIVLKLLA
jgi:hypothetical protein